MARRFDLPQTLALFPLSDVVLMPRARLPFQIFEPRYLQMIEDSLRSPHRLIGLIQPSRAGWTTWRRSVPPGGSLGFRKATTGAI